MNELRKEEELLNVTFDVLKKKVSILISEKNISEEELDNLYNKLHELDDKKEEIFQEEVKYMSTSATTLDKEKERLETLIRIIENRILDQKNIYSEYAEAVGKELKPTPNEERISDLTSLKNRLKAIDEFINHRTELNKLNALIEDDKTKLSVAVSRKKEYDNINLDLNGELYACFSSIVKERISQQETLKVKNQLYSEFYNKLLQRQLSENEINDIKRQVKIYSETLVVYKKINNPENDDIIRRKSFQCYEAKEKLLLLDIYNEILINDSNNGIMTDKRKKIGCALKEIREMRRNYNVSKETLYDNFEKAIDEQIEKISVQSQNEANIDFLNSTISNNQNKIETLKLKMNTGPIVSILQGFNRNILVEEEASEKNNNTIISEPTNDSSIINDDTEKYGRVR